MGIPPRLSLVTVGVADVAASTAFYERLGWRRADASQEGSVSFFSLQGCVLAVFGRQDLADDAAVDAAGSGFRAVSAAINLESPAAVDAAFVTWLDAGGTVVHEPREVFWGGYSGYGADPDGHLWEIAFNPYWVIDADGRVQLPG